MPSGLIKTSEVSGGYHFEARYEHPWGGVASNAAPMDIQPNQFQEVRNLNIKDGILVSTIYDTSTISTTGIVTTGGNFITQLFNIGNNLYAFDVQGNAYVYNYNTAEFVLDQTCASAAGTLSAPEPSSVKVINGIAYAISYSNSNICVYTPGVSYVLGTDSGSNPATFVGGLYSCVLDQYLVLANTNMPSDTPAVKQGRVNWSGPNEYTTFNPAVDRTAGFNVLGDVQDYISNIFALGNVGYILRNQGITQMTPTGVGIAPFDFTSLWSSTIGIGCTMPQTFSQYGNLAAWGNDTDFYLFSGGSAPAGFTGAAKTAIYSDIYAAQGGFSRIIKTFVSASFGTNSSSNALSGAASSPSPDLEYTIAIATVSATSGLYSVNIVFWIYTFATNSWMRVVSASIPLAVANNGNVYNCSFVPVNISYATSFPRFVSLLNVGFGSSVVTSVPVILAKYQAGLDYKAAAPSGNFSFDLVFKQEEVKFTRQPQVRGVAVKAFGNGLLSISISGMQDRGLNVVSFSSILVSSTQPKTYYSSGVFTGEDISLEINSANFDGNIIKASLFGTYADGEPF
jgi:hypothetical protein